MLRALAPMLFLFVITYALGSFHCSNDQVAHWGLIPVSLNLTVVASLAIFGSRWGIDGLAAATVAGGLLAFLLQARLASGDGFKEPWTRPFSAGPGRDILAGLAAFALVGGLGGDFGTAQADLFLVRFFASRLGPGTITLLALGNKLMALPVLLVGAALGLALLPSVSLALASQDHAKAGRQLSQALCCAFLLVFPFAIGYFDLGASVAQVIFCHTALQPAQLGDLGQILRAYSGAVIGMAGMFILNTYLAALRRTRALILIGIFAVVADAGLMWSFCDLYGAKGIALAVSLGSFLYCVALAAIVLPELPWAVRWILVQRIAVIAVGALGMHVFLVGAARINVFASVPWLGGTVLPLLVGVMAYLGWLALHHKRLQLAIRGA